MRYDFTLLFTVVLLSAIIGGIWFAMFGNAYAPASFDQRFGTWCASEDGQRPCQ
jgi:hypothetical protein